MCSFLSFVALAKKDAAHADKFPSAKGGFLNFDICYLIFFILPVPAFWVAATEHREVDGPFSYSLFTVNYSL